MSRVARFGVFETDLFAGELRKQGRLIRLQLLPFELLRCLLAQPGAIVTREDLRRQLWPADVVVGFDQSLNKSVTKLRNALGDSAASPTFIETVPKRGYRFIASVTFDEGLPSQSLPVASAPVAPSLPVAPDPAFSLLGLIPLGLMAALVVWLLSSAMTSPPSSETEAASASRTTATGTAPTDNAAAQEAYTRGRLALTRRTQEGMRSGITLFERAVAFDPGFASAYVGLADAWSLLASYGMEEPRQALERSRTYANRALAINPDQADAHASLGRTAMISDWDWQVSERHFQRAIEINDRSAPTHQWYAYLLSARGRHAEAEREARRATEIDPTSLNAATSVGYVLYAARRFDDAAATLRGVIEVDPDFMQARRNLGMVLALQGRNQEAVSEFERVVRLSGESAVAEADLAWVRGRAGDRRGARRLLERLQARDASGYVPPDAMALALSGAGQIDAAVTAVQAAFEARVATIAHLSVDPVWDSLRDLPSVRDMAEAVRIGRSAR